jgi:hypothetical protein
MNKLKQTNDILLHLLYELPEPQSAELRSELLLYGMLVNASMSYETAAGKIRSKASVHKRKLNSRMKEDIFGWELCLNRRGIND